jgi:predicted NBD/HSP70 family sugar kinase
MLIEDAGILRDRVVGTGAALSAPVSGSGTLASGAIFSDWVELDVSAELSKSLGVPVHVGNDANLGALAEWTFGAGRGAEHLAYVMLSAGIGAGLIVEGRLYQGATGTAGELGHVVVEPDGVVCRCGGRGCLESVAGADALVHALEHSHGTLILGDVLRLAESGDAGARRVIADAGRAVGRAVAALCSTLDPEVVVIGGEIAEAGDLLLDGIRESAERAMPPFAADSIRIVRGLLGPRAEVLGAIALALTSTPAPLPLPRTEAVQRLRRAESSG